MKIVAISDTHQHTPSLPAGDILIHCGDFSNYGTVGEFENFLRWFSSQRHLHKIVVPGNHDRYVYDFTTSARWKFENAGVRLLIDQTAYINRVAIHGYPWTPEFGSTRAFAHEPNSDTVDTRLGWLPHSPRGVDVLITHGPPFGIFDSARGIPLGDTGLSNAVALIKPKLHLFGHIHEGHGGRMKLNWLDGSSTIVANVCSVDARRKLNNDPVFTCEMERPIYGAFDFRLDSNTNVG